MLEWLLICYDKVCMLAFVACMRNSFDNWLELEQRGAWQYGVWRSFAGHSCLHQILQDTDACHMYNIELSPCAL